MSIEIGAQAGTSSASKHRINSLDSIRGLAALTVVMLHGLLILPTFYAIYTMQSKGVVAAINYSPLHIFWAGQEAVLVFFVLSGYVLSLPFLAGISTSYLAFLCKRIFRLFPAYLVALLLSAVLLSFVTDSPALSPLSAWYESTWRIPNFSWEGLLKHLFLYVPSVDSTFDRVIWTLVIEMQVSMIFPVLVLVMGRLGYFGLPAAMLLSTVVRHYFLLESIATNFEPIIQSLSYLWYFALGVELARRRNWLAGYAMGLKLGPLLAWLLVACVCLTSKWTFRTAPLWVHLFICPIGAVITITLAVDNLRLKGWLQSPVLYLLGAMSYSIYLLHYPILMFLAPRAAAIGQPWLATVVTVPLSLFCAWLSYRFVEVPGVVLGDRLLRRISGSSLRTTLPAQY